MSKAGLEDKHSFKISEKNISSLHFAEITLVAEKAESYSNENQGTWGGNGTTMELFRSIGTTTNRYRNQPETDKILKCWIASAFWN